MKMIKIIISIILIISLLISSYILYVVFSYNRIEDNLKLDIINNNNNDEIIDIDKDLTFTTYNIGFGAYSKDFTFFLDKGYDKDGNKTSGKYSRAFSKEEVIKNTTGAINIMKKLNSDFYALQEVDIKSHRAYNVNQEELINNEFKNYSNTFATNFHSAYLAYPIFKPHGKSTSGMLSLSKYKIEKSIRKQYTVSNAFPDKYMDYDRAFVVNYIPTSNNKHLVLINNHMSAYDEGGIIRKKQIKELNDFIINEYKNGNYVIVGGDFNHDLLTYNPNYNYDDENILFNNNLKRPDWISNLFDKDNNSLIDNNFKIYAADNLPSCRAVDVAYEKENCYVTTVDGFICSPNVAVASVFTSADYNDTLFNFSDHLPTTLKFSLKNA